jgi:D-serine deaminase-like pyridoxal phosphate-dependent protein
MSRGPNTALIGRPDGLARLQTPALVLDLDAMDRNIAAMAAFARRTGRQLRPHAKTHKSADVARRQLAAGAVGICCAKLSEAEALSAEGIGPLLITSPIVEPGALARLAALARRSEGLAVVVDSAPGVTTLAQALAGQDITVFVDLDPGQHRTGAPSAPAAVTLAQCIRRGPHMRFGGLQFFSGPSQHIEDAAERASDVRRRTAYLTAVVDALRNAGLPPPVVTGGGTGTHELDAGLGLITELQVGSYVFMDDQYIACQLAANGGHDFETALFVATRVISANHPGLVTLDAGYKATTGSPLPPSVAAGAPDASRYEYRGDEHGALLLPDGATAPALGDTVMLRTPHCDPTVNLYDVFHVVRGGELVDIWPVTARGCSW